LVLDCPDRSKFSPSFFTPFTVSVDRLKLCPKSVLDLCQPHLGNYCKFSTFKRMLLDENHVLSDLLVEDASVSGRGRSADDNSTTLLKRKKPMTFWHSSIPKVDHTYETRSKDK
jgi:hypothetical protein